MPQLKICLQASARKALRERPRGDQPGFLSTGRRLRTTVYVLSDRLTAPIFRGPGNCINARSLTALLALPQFSAVSRIKLRLGMLSNGLASPCIRGPVVLRLRSRGMKPYHFDLKGQLHDFRAGGRIAYHCGKLHRVR